MCVGVGGVAQLRRHGLCFFMLPRKLDRKWLSVAIFRRACTAESENVPKVTVYTAKSMIHAKREAATETCPG